MYVISLAHLREYFSQFGGLAEVSVMREKSTGRSRGFAFLTFEDGDSLDKALETPKHGLDGRIVEVKRAIPRGEVKTKSRKVFVGGVPPSSTNESLRAYFEKFGPISEAQIMKDRVRGRSRGFGFVTFEDDDAVPKVLSVAEHRLDGKLVDVKKAEPKKATTPTTVTPGVPPLQLAFTQPAVAHIHPSPNSSPRGSLAFGVLNSYPFPGYIFPAPYQVANPPENLSNLGFVAGPGFADATSQYLFSPYTSPRGSFAEADLPTDFAELSMGPFRRMSHDFSGLSLVPNPLNPLAGIAHGFEPPSPTSAPPGFSPAGSSGSTISTSTSGSATSTQSVATAPIGSTRAQYV